MASSKALQETEGEKKAYQRKEMPEEAVQQSRDWKHRQGVGHKEIDKQKHIDNRAPRLAHVLADDVLGLFSVGQVAQNSLSKVEEGYEYECKIECKAKFHGLGHSDLHGGELAMGSVPKNYYTQSKGKVLH